MRLINKCVYKRDVRSQKKCLYKKRSVYDTEDFLKEEEGLGKAGVMRKRRNLYKKKGCVQKGDAFTQEIGSHRRDIGREGLFPEGVVFREGVFPERVCLHKAANLSDSVSFNRRAYARH